MGNLNKFYLMGRVARAPHATGAGQDKTVTLAITPGTSPRSPRGGPTEPLLLEASGPQADGASQLRVGQGVFVRGQLRQEAQGSGSVLVARIQALELLSEPRRKPRPPREDGEPAHAGVAAGDGDGHGEGDAADGPGASRRRRRRRGRGRGREPGERRPAGGPPAPPARPPRPDLPPPEPVVQAPAEPVQPPPDPTLENDMPF